MSSYAEIRTVADGIWRAYEKPSRPRIDVTIATCSHAAGVSRTLTALTREIEAGGHAVDIGTLSCGGMCFLEPLVIVTQTDGRRVLYGPLTPEHVKPLLQATVAKPGVYDALAVATIAGPAGAAGPPPLKDHPFMQGQVRWLMANTGITDPGNLDHYIARSGFQGLEKALTMDAEAIVKETLDSGIWGRGGAGFPAGRKWDFLRTARNTPKYMVCNADEGDPGAFVNRIVLEGDPGLVIEGMTIGALAAGSTHGFIYIRDEYPLAIERVNRALDQARARNLLGDDILGSGKPYDMRVVRGAGAYVCGEETGLLSSIQDARGMPRIKPPFPANAGVFGLPTNVNNVESYADVPVVFREGIEHYRSVGTAKSPGTKMWSVTGDVQRVGAMEFPFGTLTGKLIEACGGPMPGHQVHIIQSGGPLAGMLPASAASAPLDLDPYREMKVLLGGGGFVICDETTCPLDLAMYFEWFAEDESCGRCTTCHGGTQRYVEVLRRIADGGGRMSDLELLDLLKDTLRWSNCFHGQGAPAAVVALLMYFRDEVIEHIQQKRCRAGVCRGLIRYEIDAARATEAAPAAAICPTGAIKAGEDGRYFVDQSLCIKCNACREVQPEVMRVQPAYAQAETAGAAAD